MSASQWTPSSDGGLLTDEDCFKLLDIDIDILDEGYDLIKNLPAAPKVETEQPFQDDISTSLYPPSPPDAKPTQAELAANDLLQQIENQCKTENIFATWMEEKVDINPYENSSQVPVGVVPSIPASSIVPVPGTQQTEELLREFENVYDTYTHLTPPQSPPGSAAQLLISYAQQAQCAPIQPVVQYPQPEWSGADFVEITPQVVNFPASQFDTPHISASSESASPQSSPPSSPRSSDDDWTVPTSRRKPYSRGSEDRHSRKKEQNKNAATRYRQKKKAEIEILLSEENTMRQRNADLGNKCSDLQREILLLKGLMRDLFKAKGLIK